MVGFRKVYRSEWWICTVQTGFEGSHPTLKDAQRAASYLPLANKPYIKEYGERVNEIVETIGW
jgi:hypothetical protein